MSNKWLDLDSIKASIKDRFKHDSTLEEYALIFLDFIANTDPREYQGMSFGITSKIMRNDSGVILADDDSRLEVIGFFTGGLSRLLDVVLTYVDEDTGTPYKLDDDQAKLLLFEDKFYHPIAHDELVENAKEHIIVSYTSSELGRALYERNKQCE